MRGLKSDIWIDSSDYKMYVWNDYEWVGLSSGDSDQNGMGFNYIPCEMDGGGAFTEDYCKDCSYNIDGGQADAEFCDLDDQFQFRRPGATVSSRPPRDPLLGQMWFDSERLEQRIFYGTENSTPRWVSAFNPGAAPTLPVDPNPEPVRVEGPTSAMAGVASDNFTTVIGANLPLPSFAWSTTDENAYIQPVGSRNVVQIVFSQTGTHKVAVTVTDRSLVDDDGNQVAYTEFVKVVVTETPSTIAATYDTVTRFFAEDGSFRYVINNQERPYLTFVRGRKYVFLLDDPSNENDSHPLRLYHDVNNSRGDVFMDGVKIADNNVQLEIQVANDAPAVLRYGDENPLAGAPDMGNLIYVVGDYVANFGSLSVGQRPEISPNRLTMGTTKVTVTDEENGTTLEDRYTIMMPPDRASKDDPSTYVAETQPDVWMYAYGTVPGINSKEYYTYTFVLENPLNTQYPFGIFLDEENEVPFNEGISVFDGGTIISFEPTADMPAVLYYGSTNEPGMGGKINIMRSANVSNGN